MRDPYSILGVQRDAGSDEIKAAWRSQAKAVHPDQNRADPDANARFAEIGQAYDLLKDPKKRGLYDQARRAAESRKSEQTIMQQRNAAREAAQRAKAAEKLMEELAKAQARTARADPAAENTKPESAEDMLERIFGADAKAKAAGAKPEADNPDLSPEENAAAQNEKAEARAAQASSFFSALLRRIRGTIAAAPEKAPDMTAEAIFTVSNLIEQKWVTITMPEDREVRFQLEPGMTDGHVVRLKAQGLKLPDAARGDLVVTLLASREDAFTIHNFDIHTSLPISLADAVLGCEATVQSPHGELKVTVPAWSGSDRAIRVDGKGLQDATGGYGDFVVELRIVLLETPDAKVTDLMRHMREGLYL
ncbi:DnaJ C-terminal domain-containing protein [Agrobacterium sp. rho-13.3]|uniref:DnaJ C-terminal domain-containing protein n=1 Tax=Agrobacterium sp. rho-13.3 TaxID=3072980 RepID=UPI002A0B6969|nr:DnaJ C-terminal domain-containing protein [Agrobacterium sp. rho-13.3]MDX8308577.1 DnaJ domain-containing protein [Agrobacterium sp. rho-13.3]